MAAVVTVVIVEVVIVEIMIPYRQISLIGIYHERKLIVNDMQSWGV
jgi:hypothetical protein